MAVGFHWAFSTETFRDVGPQNSALANAIRVHIHIELGIIDGYSQLRISIPNTMRTAMLHSRNGQHSISVVIVGVEVQLGCVTHA